MKVIDKKLTEAINLLADYADQHLPDGYVITLEFRRSEATLSLADDDGNDIEVMTDRQESHFRLACEDATELTARHQREYEE